MNSTGWNSNSNSAKLLSICNCLIFSETTEYCVLSFGSVEDAKTELSGGKMFKEAARCTKAQHSQRMMQND